MVVIDVQRDYFPGGRMELEGAEAAAANVALAIAAFRAADLPVLHIQHVSTRPGATFLLPQTDGVEFHPAVRPAPDEPVLVKHHPNGFRETALDRHQRERGIESIWLAGMMTHMCIDTTVRAAYDLGYECTVLGDACATRALDYRGRGISAEDVQGSILAALRGVFAQVMPTDEAVGAIGR